MSCIFKDHTVVVLVFRQSLDHVTLVSTVQVGILNRLQPPPSALKDSTVYREVMHHSFANEVNVSWKQYDNAIIFKTTASSHPVSNIIIFL